MARVGLFIHNKWKLSLQHATWKVEIKQNKAEVWKMYFISLEKQKINQQVP